MPKTAFRIHGVGCGLGDLIFAHTRFDAPASLPYHSRKAGDGGLQMGGLVFVNDLERFSGKPLETCLRDLTAGAAPDVFNVGGPALVSLVLAAQLLHRLQIPVAYFGLSGRDSTAERIRDILKRTPLLLDHYRSQNGATPSTFVLSDPAAQGGMGDRCFINHLGVAEAFGPDQLDPAFFDATLNLYGGTALVPALHRRLPELLQKGRDRGVINVVGTVYDFLSEKSRPGEPWRLGEGEAYPLVDLLVADREELLRLSGGKSVEAGAEALLRQGLTSLVATQGPDPVYYKSIGGIFGAAEGWVEPPSSLVERVRRRQENPGDTTGAGDNFLGALVAQMMLQIHACDLFSKGETPVRRDLLHMKPLDLRQAVEFASAAGGLACLQYGGTYLEKHPGEKYASIRACLDGKPAA